MTHINDIAIGDVINFMFLSDKEEGVVMEILSKENKLLILDSTGIYHRVSMTKADSKFCYVI
jgi:hypothetical protein